MLRIKLITVGKCKERYLREACAEYEKRISRFANLEIIELPEARLPEQPSEKELLHALDQEADAILRLAKGYVIALCMEGKLCTSEAFSQTVSQLGVLGESSLCLIIGSSFGLSARVKQRADLRLSMSPMTFPHQLARVMLLEQLYRAFQIAAGGKYHK